MDKRVKIYTLSTCSHCKATKRFLDENNVLYAFTDVDLLQGAEQEAAIEDVTRLNPHCSFPTIIIGDQVIMVICPVPAVWPPAIARRTRISSVLVSIASRMLRNTAVVIAISMSPKNGMKDRSPRSMFRKGDPRGRCSYNSLKCPFRTRGRGEGPANFKFRKREQG